MMPHHLLNISSVVFIFKVIINKKVNIVNNCFSTTATRIVSYRIVSYRIVNNHIVSFRIGTYRIVWWPYRLIPTNNFVFFIHNSLLKMFRKTLFICLSTMCHMHWYCRNNKWTHLSNELHAKMYLLHTCVILALYHKT